MSQTETYRPWYKGRGGAEQRRLRVSPDGLICAVAGILQDAGFHPGQAATAADVIVAADLRGVASHGVSNMLWHYLDWASTGVVDPAAEPEVVRESSSFLMADGRRSLGVGTMPQIARQVVKKASKAGIAMASVGNSTHLGMAGYHAMLALEHDQIGICTTSTAAASAFPTFAAKTALGTNPIAFAAPTAKQAPFVFDAATTVSAGNRVASARIDRIQVPPGILADESGVPYEQAVDAPEDWRHLLMLGGTPDGSSHKGYGLATMVEILGRVLSLQPLFAEFGRGTACHFFASISLEVVTDPALFKQGMDDLISSLNALPSNTPGTTVLVAGQRAHREQQENLERGVPLHPQVYERVARACQSAGIEPPEVTEDV